MTKATRAIQTLPVQLAQTLAQIGGDIKTARKRRRISQRDMAERMMVSLDTVQRLEKGDTKIGFGILASALWVLGLHRRLAGLAAPETDRLGMNEEIRRLPKSIRKTASPDDEF